mgnify:CR=1 FL=1
MAIDFLYPQYEVVRNPARCIACRACERQCSNEVHAYDDELKMMISDESRCVNCHRCVSICPTRALKIVKTDHTFKENANWSGETIMEVVPAEDRLLINARVKPSDIAFLKPGQEARIRISAYDSSIFGTLPGKVLRVGADAIADPERKESFFEVLIESRQNYLGDASEHLDISPGMAADASIQTGKRTMMEYMLKPIVKTLDKSLRER